MGGSPMPRKKWDGSGGQIRPAVSFELAGVESAAVAVGVAGHGAFDLVPSAADVVLHFFPGAFAAAIGTAVPVAMEVVFDVVEVSAGVSRAGVGGEGVDV